MRRLKNYNALFTLVSYLFKSTSDGEGMKQRHVSCCEDTTVRTGSEVKD